MKRMLATLGTAMLVAAGYSAPALAQGQDPFLGQTMLVGFTFCPRNWIEAAGQLLPISQYTALFSLLGTTYGGDGRTTFALPDLRGRVPVHVGQGPGLPIFVLGQAGGQASTTLTVSELPAHTHAMMGTSNAAASNTPSNNLFGTFTSGGIYDNNGSPDVVMNPSAVGNTGGGQPLDNMMPYVALRYCIAMQGIFPPRP